MLKVLIAALALSASLTANAQDAQLFRARTSCSARSIDRFYCPWFGGGQFQGPYFDNGCSVKCSSGKQAVCHEATCEDDQSGQPIYSKCECK